MSHSRAGLADASSVAATDKDERVSFRLEKAAPENAQPAQSVFQWLNHRAQLPVWRLRGRDIRLAPLCPETHLSAVFPRQHRPNTLNLRRDREHQQCCRAVCVEASSSSRVDGPNGRAVADRHRGGRNCALSSGLRRLPRHCDRCDMTLIRERWGTKDVSAIVPLAGWQATLCFHRVGKG